MVLVYAAPKLNSSFVTNVLFVQLEDLEGVLMRVELDPPLCILGISYLIIWEKFRLRAVSLFLQI